MPLSFAARQKLAGRSASITDDGEVTVSIVGDGWFGASADFGDGEKWLLTQILIL
jgi:hypothetical protein